MKINNFRKTLLLTICIATALPSVANSSNSAPAKEISSTDKARAEEILKRLEEIKSMDISSMPASQKRQLRKEVKAAKKELKQVESSGVYISVGALIIIILLLILIL